MQRNVMSSRCAGFALALTLLAAPSVAIGDPTPTPHSPPSTPGVSGALNATHGATQSAIREARAAASRRAESLRKKHRSQSHLSAGEPR